MAWFSWRPDYKERLSVEPETGAVEAEASQPWYSSLGIYHHYTLQVRPGAGQTRAGNEPSRNFKKSFTNTEKTPIWAFSWLKVPTIKTQF